MWQKAPRVAAALTVPLAGPNLFVDLIAGHPPCLSPRFAKYYGQGTRRPVRQASDRVCVTTPGLN